MRLVVDASAAVDVLVPGLRRASARRHLRGSDLIAPHLVDTEVLSALARLEHAAAVTTAEANAAIADWRRLPCERVSVEPLIEQVWRLRAAIRVADAHYVGLALATSSTLLTSDARLARAGVPGLAVLLVA